MDDETPMIEAYTIEIKYYFDADGTDWVSVAPNSDISSALLLGILDLAKFHVRYPPDEEDY